MRLVAALAALTLHGAPGVSAQTCSGVSGPFTLSDITGQCTYETLLNEYTRQVFDATGSTCAEGSTLTAQEDFDLKLTTATGAANGPDGADVVCRAMYDSADQTPYTKGMDKGTDYHFEQMFYNGRGDWQEEVETIYETDDRSATSVLDEDAAKVSEFFRGDLRYSRVEWPNMLTNFEDSTCEASHAAMCCWPKDRQPNDGNGNCNSPTDEECVDKDPGDNTNLCFADLAKGNLSTGFDSASGFTVFPEDGNNGEGSIHCHGLAWSDDMYNPIARYRGNNLFYVSVYDHLYVRGYAKNIPGMPMCGCLDQMPLVTRSDCTQVDVTEDWKVEYDGTTFVGHIEKAEIQFNECQGAGGRTNDLYAYAKKLYKDSLMTRHQFGAVGRVLTNNNNCYRQTEYEKAMKGYIPSYAHDEATYTKVAARDDMKDMEPFGREAFEKALFNHSLTAPYGIIYRICPFCAKTHRKVWYRRLTPVSDPDFDLLHHILTHDSSEPHPEPHPDNVFGEDFTLHSSYEDAVSGANPWQCPPNDGFNYRKNFVGNCSPDGTLVGEQHTNFRYWWGPRKNVAYYVNKPEDHGVQDYVDSTAVTRAAGLTDIDIGEVGIEGNTLESDGVYHITGSGSNVWGNSDQFHYLSEPWEGDIDVKVHVTDFSNNGNNWDAKAGIMLRSDNSPDATYAFAILTANEGLKFQHRRSKGNNAGGSGSFLATPAQTSAWLRIIKKLETVEFYWSDDGMDWNLQVTDTFFFPNDSYRVGLAVCSRRNDYLAEATFDSYDIAEYSFPTSAPSLSSAPTPWQPMVDIGPHTRAGQYSLSSDSSIQYVKGSGTGIWGSADDFFFYNEQLPNVDMTVEMYIERFDNNELFGRGGIMIRDSNDPSAANAFVGAAGRDQGAVFQSRTSAGGATAHHKMIFTNWINQHWVKLVKAGDVVTAYYKETGDDWTELGSTTLVLTGSTVQVGRAVAYGSDVTWHLTMDSSQYSVVTGGV